MILLALSLLIWLACGVAAARIAHRGLHYDNEQETGPGDYPLGSMWVIWGPFLAGLVALGGVSLVCICLIEHRPTLAATQGGGGGFPVIDTLDDLISVLTSLRATMPLGGASPVAIDDADTGYHMRIQTIRPSNNHPERVLVEGMGYAPDDGCLPQ